MLKIYFLFFCSLTLQLLADNQLSNLAENNSTKNLTSPFNLVKVNKHTITTKLLGAKKVHAFIYKFNSKDRNAILNQLVNDEIAIEYAFNYLKLEDNISDEKKRLDLGLKQINKIVIQESIKNISDENASEYYKIHKKMFWHKKHYEASHILVYDKNISVKLLKELNKTSDLNSTFKKLAKEFSKDRSSKKGGYLGHFESKIMVKPFKDALEKLKIGDFTKSPVKTKFGYHIILLHNIAEEGYIPFERIKDDIKRILAEKNKNEWFEKTLLPLKKKATIDYLFDVNKSY